VHVSDVRQIEVHTAEPSIPGPSCLEVEIANAKMEGARGSVVVKALCYKPEGRGFDSR
jgi:hypothetical protein